ncbi:MAG: DUF411 domain-containing protein, partial [Pseudomonadota bacterium]
TFVIGVGAAGGLAIAACGRAQRNPASTPRKDAADIAAGRPTVAAAMIVYRDPSCGCCEAWTNIARKAGYQAELTDDQDMPAIKRKQGVPEQLWSCHTALVGGYTIEGHVPFEEIRRLLAQRPRDIVGIAVAGMPRGAPGMEMPDGSKDAFRVAAFDRSGQVRAFS